MERKDEAWRLGLKLLPPSLPLPHEWCRWVCKVTQLSAYVPHWWFVRKKLSLADRGVSKIYYSLFLFPPLSVQQFCDCRELTCILPPLPFDVIHWNCGDISHLGDTAMICWAFSIKFSKNMAWLRISLSSFFLVYPLYSEKDYYAGFFLLYFMT